MHTYTYDAGTLLQHTTPQIIFCYRKRWFQYGFRNMIQKGFKHVIYYPLLRHLEVLGRLVQGQWLLISIPYFFYMYSMFFLYVSHIFSICIPFFAYVFHIFSLIFPHYGNHGIHIPSIFLLHLFHIDFICFNKKWKQHGNNMGRIWSS